MKTSDKVILLWSFLTIGGYYPAFWTSGIIGVSSFYTFAFFLIIWLLLVRKIRGKLVGLHKTFNRLMILTVLFAIFKMFVSFGNTEFFILLIQLVSFYIFVFTGYNAFKDKDILMRYFVYFNILMIFLTIIGTFLYYAQLLPPRRLIPIGTSGHEQLADYVFFYIKMRTNDYLDLGHMMRPAGWYDEPGSFGFVLILLVYYCNKQIGKKWIEYFMLFGGLITLSFAYIAAAILYFFLFISGRRGVIGTIVVVVVAYIFLYSVQYDEDSFGSIVYKYTIERSENVFSGNDNRDFDTGKKAFFDNSIVGESVENLSSNYPGITHETIWFYLANYGLIGGIIMFLPFLYPMIASKRLSDKKYLLVIILLAYQRPYLMAPLYLLIFYFTFYVNQNKTVELTV